jgi:Lrp/AsnC family transcriptional regulator
VLQAIMDKIDLKILNIIQKNATVPLSELAKKVGITSTPCWNRVKKMEENGTINSKITVLNNKKINLPVTVFLSVSIGNHQEEWLARFNKTVLQFDQITEVYRVASSSMDYLLKIVSPSIEEYDKFQQTLINDFEFTRMTSNICLKEIKKNHFLPLDYA